MEIKSGFVWEGTLAWQILKYLIPVLVRVFQRSRIKGYALKDTYYEGSAHANMKAERPMIFCLQAGYQEHHGVVLVQTQWPEDQGSEWFKSQADSKDLVKECQLLRAEEGMSPISQGTNSTFQARPDLRHSPLPGRAAMTRLWVVM